MGNVSTDLDPAQPLAAIDAAAKECSNWGRWGADDTRGTINFITEEKRRAAAGLVRRGVPFSLAVRFGADGPQTGAMGRINPLYSVRTLSTGDPADGPAIMPHGFGVVDDMVVMPLQCCTQWDALGHVFDRGRAWNGRRAADVASVWGDRATGVEHLAEPVVGRGVLLDVARVVGEGGELPDGFAITVEHLERTIEAQGGVEVGRGDLMLVRTGQLTRARRDGWGTYSGGPAPGLSFTTAGWLHGREIAAVATDTWGCEVRPNEFAHAFQPLHQVLIPHVGMPIGEIWNLDALAEDCASDGVYEFWLTAGPIPFTGAVGAPVNPIAVK